MQQKQNQVSGDTLSSPTGPSEDLTMFATAWHAITADKQKKNKQTSVESTQQHEQNKNIIFFQKVTTDRLHESYRFECERLGRTGARQEDLEFVLRQTFLNSLKIKP